MTSSGDVSTVVNKPNNETAHKDLSKSQSKDDMPHKNVC